MYVASFTQISQNPKEEFEKVGLPVFAILRGKKKTFWVEVGVASGKVIQLHSGNLGIVGFSMCDIQCGSYRQTRVGLGYGASCRWIHVVFCV